ncbi:MAG: signal peptidase II [Blastocatellia bacterium]|nr:signal peptidase II [Blastocatellia bacterium]
MLAKFSYLFITIVVLVIDQLTKQWAITSLKPISLIEVIPGFFRLAYATNRGVAFSMFAESEMNVRLIFAIVSTLAAIFVVIYLARTPASRIRMNAALSLLLAGIIGNLIDRVRLGEVVDFLDFHLGEKYIWPTFNVADAAICFGALLLALEMLREERTARIGPGTPSPEESTIGPSD